MMMWDLIVLGGGAAGMAAAISSSEQGERVLILEKMDRVGKKILATGNGRCNLMNRILKPYPCGERFADQVFDRFPPESVASFFRHLGLELRTEGDGRVYPASLQASSVLDVLRLKLVQLGVEILTEQKVDRLSRTDSLYTVRCGGNTYYGKRILLCTGGKAQEKLGSDGSGYRLAQGLGHSMIPVRPGLIPLVTEKEPIRGLEGIRVRCAISVYDSGKTSHSESGEVLFTAYGLSGICVMNVSRYCQPGSRVLLNLGAGLQMSKEEIQTELYRFSEERKQFPSEMLLTGMFVRPLNRMLLVQSGIRPEKPIYELTHADLERIADKICCYPVEVTGLKGFEQAQVTLGGLDPEEFDPKTMESRYASGLYAAGEILNVHGDCGGYNLMFAFASGILAGLHGARGCWEDN